MIIEKEKAYLFKQVNITWYAGIDAVELKDGTYFIEDKLLDSIPVNLTVSKINPVDFKEVTINVKEELAKCPKNVLEAEDFKI